MKTELLQIKTFRGTKSDDTSCDVVQVDIETRDDGTLSITALVVPFICNPLTTQPIDHSGECYDHLWGLELADSADTSDTLEVGVLIGSDSYWNFVTGRVIKGESGPTAIHTRVGWVLSGPANRPETTVNLALATTHVLKIEACSVEGNLDDHLKQFWEVESLGVTEDETSVYDNFVQQIKYDGQRYEVSLPFFDPLGVVSPVTISFKMFCQQLFKEKIGWDDLLTGSLLERWKQLLPKMKESRVITIPRCLFSDISPPLNSVRLVRFCDASTKAVVYLRLESEEDVDVKFIAAKTRVTPVGGMTIPRLELLSAVLLSKLITSIHSALKSELSLEEAVCFTDSKVSLYWMQGVNHEWKQFVENRVNMIRRLVHPRQWKHCPGKENPADIPSRGVNVTTLTESSIWLKGPEWLTSKTCSLDVSDVGPHCP